MAALDPDIPADRQRTALQASAADDTLRWTLDGTALGGAGERVLWAPRPGKHRLALVDARGREVDAVSFEVRGSPR